MPETSDLERIASLLHDFVDSVNNVVLDGLDLELAQILIETLNRMMDALIRKQEAGVSVKNFIGPYLFDMFKMLLKAHGVLLSFKLLGKVEPQGISDSKAKISQAFAKLALLSQSPDENFVDANLPRFIAESYSRMTVEDLSAVALQSAECRSIFTLFDYINETRLQLEVKPLSSYTAAATQQVLDNASMLAITEANDEDEEESKDQQQARKVTAFEEICRILKGIMGNSNGKNFKVKRLATYTLLPKLFNTVRPILTPAKSALILTLMESATKIDWGSKAANEE